LLAARGPYHQLYNAQFEDDSKTVSKPRHANGPSLPKSGQRNRNGAAADGFWYRESRRSKLLAPAAWAFAKVAGRRREAFASGAREVWKAPVPVIVVGNITVGGTGKTPFVIWLVRWLRQQGLQPGIVSRGYGGSAQQVTRVAPNADPAVVGDEPPLLARRTGAPVVIGKDRVAAVQHLLKRWSVDVVIADDGLQHYALGRDVEIVLIDGTRGLGNGMQLPAGPLREPAERLQEVDWVVANGTSTGLVSDEAVMHVVPQAFVKVSNSRVRLSVTDFIAAHRDVHAVAAIGNPERFAQTLRNIGLVPLLRSYPDHHMFDGSELARTDSHVFVCTEKDAVKLATLVDVPADLWYLEIDVNFNDVAQQQLQNLMIAKGLLEAPTVATIAPVDEAPGEPVATAKDAGSGES
jgi:tetraacyldisaccharide 4'-kinase